MSEKPHLFDAVRHSDHFVWFRRQRTVNTVFGDCIEFGVDLLHEIVLQTKQTAHQSDKARECGRKKKNPNGIVIDRSIHWHSCV